jgi:hypothetical protein
VNLLVDRLREIVEDLMVARSRCAFLSALDHFERVLAVVHDGPPGTLTDADGQTIGALADTVLMEIEERLDRRIDRARVQRTLAAAIDEIRRQVDTIDSFVRDGAGFPARNTSRRHAV